MSMISDIVEKLRTESRFMGTYGTDYMATLLMRSADTIEILSKKAREPKRGEWIEWVDCEGEVFWKCSACGQVSEASAAGILYKFCPFCGADMRERESE